MKARILALCVALVALLGVAGCTQTNVVFSENFDKGTLGQSIKDKPLSWRLIGPNAAEVGDVKLGSGEHGWSGLYIQGSTATAVDSENVLMKWFPFVSNEWVEVSCKAYAAGTTSDDNTVGLCVEPSNPRRVMWVSTPDGWRLLVGADGTDGSIVYNGEAFVGGHDTTVSLSLTVDTVKLKTWGKAEWTDAAGKPQSFQTAKYDCDRSLATVAGVVISMDRRSGRTGMDIDDIAVRKQYPVDPTAVVKSAAGWKKHTVRQMAGKGKEVPIPAQLQIVSQEYNGVMAVPYIAYLPEKNRIVMLVSCGIPHQAMILYSDDMGKTWTDPKRVSTAADGMGIALTKLGGGRLMIYFGGKHWYSNDYGETWGDPTDIPPCSNGNAWIEWDPPLVDFDKKTGKVKRLLSFSTDNHEKEKPYPEGQFLGYVRFSDDEGKTWRDEIKVPQMYATNEVVFVRAANGDIIASCRTDNPERFRYQIDHYGGLAVCISKDNGLTWSEKNWLYEWGRHHASMVLMPNKDIVMTYVVRLGYTDAADGLPQFGIEAVVSHDNGQTWDLDHKYILHAWKGNHKGDDGWTAGSQATSTELLPDGSLLTAFGTGFRIAGGGSPRDVGLVKWRLNTKPVTKDTTIADAPFDSDLRNKFDPRIPDTKKP